MMKNLKIAATINPVAFSIGEFSVYWYGIIIVVGIAAAVFVGMYLSRYRKGIVSENILDAALLVIPLGILGARLFYALSDNDVWTFVEFFTNKGGLSILGGVIGGSLGLFLIAKIKKINALSLRDVIVPCVLLAQAIGRWGNFVNEEVYGTVITNPAWQWFPFAVQIGGSSGAWHHALFFYESIINILGALILFIMLKKIKIEGIVGFAYFLWYGVWRSILEGMRMDEYQLGIDKFMASRFVSIIFAVIGAAGIIYLIYQDKKKKSALAGAAAPQPLSNSSSSAPSDQAIQWSDAEKENAAAAPEIKPETQSEHQHEHQPKHAIAIQSTPVTAHSEEKPQETAPAPHTAAKRTGINPAIDDFDNEIRLTERVYVPEGFKPEATILDQDEIDKLSRELDEIERSLIHIRTAPPPRKPAPKAQKHPPAATAAAKKTAAAPATAKQAAAKPATAPAAAKTTASKKPVTKTTTKSTATSSSAPKKQPAKPATKPAPKKPAEKKDE